MVDYTKALSGLIQSLNKLAGWRLIIILVAVVLCVAMITHPKAVDIFKLIDVV